MKVVSASSTTVARTLILLTGLCLGSAALADGGDGLCFKLEGPSWCKKQKHGLINIRVKDKSSARWPISRGIHDWNVTPGVNIENGQHMYKVGKSPTSS